MRGSFVVGGMRGSLSSFPSSSSFSSCKTLSSSFSSSSSCSFSSSSPSLDLKTNVENSLMEHVGYPTQEELLKYSVSSRPSFGERIQGMGKVSFFLFVFVFCFLFCCFCFVVFVLLFLFLFLFSLIYSPLGTSFCGKWIFVFRIEVASS